MKQYDIGLIGLAVMGQNLVLNMERNGFSVAVFNRSGQITSAFVKGPAKGKNIKACQSLSDLLASLKPPRILVIMVKAGAAVDDVLSGLDAYLNPGDIVIDGGNSHFRDTERRSVELAAKHIHFMGVGISGGEEGALWGPSIMPGGPLDAYKRVESLLETIAAKVNGQPCVAYLGPRGAGHLAKMVHNAIEYGDMQLIAEAYDVLHRGLGYSSKQIHDVFAGWNNGPLNSYLMEITEKIFTRIDDETQIPIVEQILDQAEQKGTGRWTGIVALELGVPMPTIQAAVEARVLSSLKDERSLSARIFPMPIQAYCGDANRLVQDLGDALYASKICAYAQGMALLRQAARVFDYPWDGETIARIWRGGCIIRARFLDDVGTAFNKTPDLANLLIANFFAEAVSKRHGAWRRVVATAATLGIPFPAISASLAYFDAYRSARLPANLIQAQRDYFGAHTYRRTDRDGIFHTQWNP